MKHAKVELEIEEARNIGSKHWECKIFGVEGGGVLKYILARASGDNKEEAKANAELIAEAFNVTNETGKTPRQLAEINKELLKVSIVMQGRMEQLINVTPTGDLRNCLTDENIEAFAAIHNATK